MPLNLTISFANFGGGATVPVGSTAQIFANGVDTTVASPLDTKNVNANISINTSALQYNTPYQITFSNAAGFNGIYQFATPQGGGVTVISVPVYPTPSTLLTTQAESRPLYDIIQIQSPSLTGGKLNGTVFSAYANTAANSLLSLSGGIFSLAVPNVPSGFSVWSVFLKGYIQGTATGTTTGNISVWAEAPNTTLTTIPASSVNLVPPTSMSSGQPATLTLEADIVFRNVTGVYMFSVRPSNFSSLTAATLFLKMEAL